MTTVWRTCLSLLQSTNDRRISLGGIMYAYCDLVGGDADMLPPSPAFSLPDVGGSVDGDRRHRLAWRGEGDVRR